jgi:hypothetical protein
MNAHEVNKNIIRALQSIQSSVKATLQRGENMEMLMETQLLLALSPLGGRVLTLKEWRVYKNAESPYNFSYPNLAESTEHPLIVRQPNGNKMFPDFLVIYNKIGLPLEIKSAESDKIMWNEGFPRQNALYIFNMQRVTTKNPLFATTYFLGQHLVSTEELKDLLLLKRETRELKQKANTRSSSTSRWTGGYHVRPQYNNHRESYFSDVSLKERRERETLCFIDTLTWDENQTYDFADEVDNLV